MTDNETKLLQLQQIPVFALRQAVTGLIDRYNMEKVLHERIQTILGVKSRQLKRLIHRLSREQLTRLINACPEISDAQVQELFEEYRYGASPSFYIFTFNTRQLKPLVIENFRKTFEYALKSSNARMEEGLPRLRRIELNDLIALPDRKEIIEGTYRFQARLDYIDKDQNAVSTYQTLYGFFWLNTVMGYSIIQARSPEVLWGLVEAVQAGTGVSLHPLVISKQLKNALPFLMRDSFRSGRLYDPNPNSKRFRWLAITDEAPYEKGYEEYETDYPEVRSARYRQQVDDEKETSLTIRCDQGAFSLAGKFRASQFRSWCLDRLGKLIEVLNGFHANLPEFVQTQQLANAPELARFSPEQKELIIKLIFALLTLKQAPELGEQPIDLGALEIASILGEYVRVQVLYECSEPDCDEEDYLTCQDCNSTLFILRGQEKDWTLVCPQRRRQPITYKLPLAVQTEKGHEFTLDANELARVIELLPGKDLLGAMADAINRRLPGLTFDPSGESFILRGSNLIYYPEPPQMKKGVKNIFFIRQDIGYVEAGAKVTGANVGQK